MAQIVAADEGSGRSRSMKHDLVNNVWVNIDDTTNYKVTVAHTLAGDANLDGTVNGTT